MNPMNTVVLFLNLMAATPAAYAADEFALTDTFHCNYDASACASCADRFVSECCLNTLVGRTRLHLETRTAPPTIRVVTTVSRSQVRTTVVQAFRDGTIRTLYYNTNVASSRLEPYANATNATEPTIDPVATAFVNTDEHARTAFVSWFVPSMNLTCGVASAAGNNQTT